MKHEFRSGEPGILSVCASFSRKAALILAPIISIAASEGALLHEWKFDESSGTTLVDSIGTAHARIVIQPGGGGYTLGNGAIRLDGGDRTTADHVSFPETVFDGLTDMTMELWTTPHSFPNWGRILDVGPGTEAAVVSGQNLLRFSFSQGVNGNLQRGGIWGLPNLDTALPTTADQRYHHVITWDADGGTGGGGLIRYFRDGSLVGTQETGTTRISTLAALPTTSFWLGRSHFAADANANASYQCVRLYDEVLPAPAILAHTIQGPDRETPVGATGLIHRWSFNGNLTDTLGGSTASTVDPDANATTGGGANLATHPGEVLISGGPAATSSYVSLGSHLLAGKSNPVTLEFWATQRSLQNWGRVFDFGSGTTENLFMSWNRNGVAAQDRVGFNDGGPEAGVSDSNAPYTVGTQFHIVLILEPGAGAGGTTKVTWYSAPSASTAAATQKGTFNTPFTLAALDDSNNWLGRSQYPADATANASYNEVRIYDRALSTAEILLNRINGPDVLDVTAPVAKDDSAVLNFGGKVAINVIGNDEGTALNAATLTITTPPAGGTATVRADGRILYSHGGGPSSTDSFTYTVGDSFGNISGTATVHLEIRNGQRLAAITTLPAAPPPVAIQAVDAFPGLAFEDALCIRSAPGETKRIFIGERRGRISYVPDTQAVNPSRGVMLDITTAVSFDNTNEGELGLLSFALHPNFANNGYVYVCYMAPGSPYFIRVSRFTLTKNGSGAPILTEPTVQAGSELILISQIDTVFNHNGGDIHFGPDGYLYISLGDEGNQMNQKQNSQRIDKNLFSSILRIDVDRKTANLEPNAHASIPTDAGIARFKIPADNPFIHTTLNGTWDGSFNGSAIADLSKVRTEFWAVGMRSPWRMGFDPATGELWVGDVGQDTYEEVDIIQRGRNYGWAFREGFQSTPGTPSTYIGTPPAGFTYADPVWDYRHPATGVDPNFAGQSVTGGVVYHGTRIPSLTGAYVFSDFRTGNVWALRRENGGAAVQRIAGEAGIAGFGTDPSNGDVLMADYSENKIKRLILTDVGTTTFPDTLTKTGLFADLATLSPSPGVVAYEPNVSFWSDHAIKRRWFGLPGTTETIGYSQDGNWSFPNGMFWMKHFDLETERGNPATRKRIETRVLVRTPAGSYGVSYKWNEAGTEAYLAPDQGETFGIPVTVNGTTAPQTYEIPSRTSCMLCHTIVGGHALGFNTRQLYHEGSLLGIAGNQIQSLRAAGYLDGPAPSLADVIPYAPANDSGTNLEFRARSYLATNCSQCHQPGGAAPSTWDARGHIALDETGLLNGPAERDGSDPANRLIVPGDAGHSILLQRIKAGNGFTRMPPIGSHVLDQTAIDLVTAWINQELPQRILYSDWRYNFFTPNNPDGDRGADPDGDGLTNFEEFLQGSSPLVKSKRWQASIQNQSPLLKLGFLRQPHRGYLIETSTDLNHWALWNHPANTLRYPPAEEWSEFSIDPAEDRSRFFRVKMRDQ